MDNSDVKRLKELEEENTRLKIMYAELSLDHTILKDVITKKLGSFRQRELAEEIVKEHKAPIRRICKIVQLTRRQRYK